MRLTSIATSILMLAMPGIGHADPVGTFSVQGTNPDASGGVYTGSVSITRSGDTYKVAWKIGNTVFSGTGVGAKMIDGRFASGAASTEDTAVSIAYGSGDTFGNALYFEQPDGTWRGTWTYDALQRTASEVWTPKQSKQLQIIAKPDANEPDLRSLSAPVPAQASPKS